MIKLKVPGMFMKKVMLLRHGGGSYINGEWKENAPSSIEIRASIQPLPSTQYRLLPEGDSPLKYRSIFTNRKLEIESDAGNRKPDEIIDGSKTYIMMEESNWIENGHYEGIFKQV